MDKISSLSSQGKTTLEYNRSMSENSYKLFKRLGYNLEELNENKFILKW
jgi:hypothetical protein